MEADFGTRMIMRKRKAMEPSTGTSSSTMQATRKTRFIRGSNDEINVAKCSIENLPAELLVKIFERMDFQTRLRAEGVCRNWQKITKELGWRQFSQCHVDYYRQEQHNQLKNAPESKRWNDLFGWERPELLCTLFKRCGPYCEELIVAPTTPMGKMRQPDVDPLFQWLHLLFELKSLYIAHRHLSEEHFKKLGQVMSHRLRCLHLESCCDKIASFPLIDFPFLRYLSFMKSKQDVLFVMPDSLRQLKLDDSFDHFGLLTKAALCCPQLIGLSLIFMRPIDELFPLQKNLMKMMFSRLQHLELTFNKVVDETIVSELKDAIPQLLNLRILTLTKIDGQILSEIVKNCVHLEQLEYSSHEASILPAFSQISKLEKLRVLWVRHNKAAKPTEKLETVKETLANLAIKGKLEFLSVNFKLSMELAVQLVSMCKKLYYLEYAQPPNNLDSLIEALRKSQEEEANHRILQFRIPYDSWWKRKQQLKGGKAVLNGSPWLKLRYQPPRTETPVMKEHLACVFEGDEHIPDFLINWLKEDDGSL